MTPKRSRKPPFVTPENFAGQQAKRMEPPRGSLAIATCSAGAYLARRVVDRYRQLLSDSGSRGEVLVLDDIETSFSDSETVVRLGAHVSGCDVFLFQGLYDPASDEGIDRKYMAFLVASRTFREHGASHVTAVLPYLAYARQDKPTKFTREPTTAKLMADLTIEAGVDRLVTWAPHSGQIRGFYGSIPVNALESLTLFVDEFEALKNREDVIVVAPDAGAAKLVTHFGRALNLKCAIASKFRPRAEEAEITEIIGDFRGKRLAIILDDMISSGSTVHALARKLVHEKNIEEIQVGVSHNLCVGRARERLVEMRDRYRLERMIVTNSIPQTDAFLGLPFVSERCLADLLSRTVNRIHYNRSVSEIFHRDWQG